MIELLIICCLTQNNNYTPPPPSPSPSPHLSSPLPADMDTVDGSDEPSYPAGSIVWGKLPRYEWWPGIIVSCSQDRSGEGRDTPEETTSEAEEEGGGGGIKVCQVWVKWCGENNLSHVSPFHRALLFLIKIHIHFITYKPFSDFR